MRDPELADKVIGPYRELRNPKHPWTVVVGYKHTVVVFHHRTRQQARDMVAGLRRQQKGSK